MTKKKPPDTDPAEELTIDYLAVDELVSADRNAKDDACWLWPGTRDAKGYGVFSSGQRGTAKQYRLARVVLACKLGRELAADEQACHTCDNPPCFNAAHLFVGTAVENQHDKGRKGRAAKGERNGASKLRPTDVRAIRRALAAGQSKAAIGRAYGVTSTTVLHIEKGEQWSHVA